MISSLPTMRHIQTFITRYQDLQDAFARHAPISRRELENTTRHQDLQDGKTYKTHSTARSHYKTRSGKHNKTHSRITRRQDLQYPHSNSTLPCQDAFKKHKTNSHLTRRQDLQDAFEGHAPISRRVQKNKTRRIRS